MTSGQKTTQWYDDRASALARQYERVEPEVLHAWFADLLPAEPGVVFDIGAGIGRDATWFADRGFAVYAVEPSTKMREEGEKRSRDGVTWRDDRLPALSATIKMGVAADVVFLGAVWMHVAPADRRRAFRKLVSLAKSGGLILFSLRRGPEDGRGFHPVSVDEIEELASHHGVVVARVCRVPDAQGRQGIEWDCVALRVPDDGTGALPVLRHLILHDDKTATYKLGLLRTLCRVAADGSGLTSEDGDDQVVLPLGIVAAYWLRLYLPLLANGLRQRGGDMRPGEGLGFVSPDGVGALLASKFAPYRLRVGATFSGNDADAVHAALRAAADCIKKNPATFATYPNSSEPIFDCRRRPEEGRRKAVRFDAALALDAAYLESFGRLRVHRDVWRALQRFGHWIEPSLIAEWIGMIKDFARNRGQTPGEGVIAEAMTWLDPERDTAEVRNIVLARLETGRLVRCVWTGEPVTAKNFDVDHCFPWSAWACSDLWNLAPSLRRVNQHQKKSLLPADTALRSARDNFVAWWTDAYLNSAGESSLSPRFQSEAHASLAALGDNRSPSPEAVHNAMLVHRTRLWRDQRIPEWDGVT